MLSRAKKLLLLAIVTILQHRRLIRQGRRPRRWWRRPSHQRREELGEFAGLIPHLRDRDSEMYFKYMRMRPARFEHLLSLVATKLSRPCARREAVPAEEKLMMTLCYLASGCSQADLSFRFGRGRSTVSGVVFETAIAIYDKLASTYLQFPASAEEWKAIAGGFWEKWHFPNCLGAIDGKHFKVHCPRNTGSQYFNYKQQFSSLVLAMCDSNYIFTYIESGSAGRE
ncbi:hypothetical protein BOX15_Mlig023191g1 [Macrostomum lignano]|uniref:Uncharacterized protein n=1 Tax=Macrostomum lignano TaxID=282301 RepID=A0A267F3F4_9PLAT|nr:hypothetical protein BOX15_Mlig023191g1 [Macrostomum lignano]